MRHSRQCPYFPPRLACSTVTPKILSWQPRASMSGTFWLLIGGLTRWLWKKRAGAGGAFNDNWAPMVLTPQGKLIQTVQNGIAIVDDGENSWIWGESCSFVSVRRQLTQLCCLLLDMNVISIVQHWIHRVCAQSIAVLDVRRSTNCTESCTFCNPSRGLSSVSWPKLPSKCNNSAVLSVLLGQEQEQLLKISNHRQI